MQNENIDDLLDQFNKIERESTVSEHGIISHDYDTGIQKSSQGSFSLRELFSKKNLLNIGVLYLGFFIWSLIAVALLDSKCSRTEEDVFSWKKYLFNVLLIFVSLIVLFVLIQWIRKKYFSV